MNYYEPTINDTFNEMIDSVNMIERVIAENIHSLAAYDILDKNYRHLELMCLKEEIIADGRSLAPFTDAIVAGRAFTGFSA